MRRATGIAVVALLMAGCHTVRGDLIDRADKAAEKGDVVNAALWYQQACGMDRSDTDVCNKAAQTATQALAQLTAQAKTALAARDVIAAVNALGPAYRLSQGPEVTTLLDQAGALQAELCGSDVEHLDATVLRVQCLEQLSHQIPVPSYAARIAQARADAAALAQRLADADANRLPGASYSLYSLARCLSSDPRFSQEREAQLARFVQKSQVPLGLSVGGNALGIDASAVCNRLKLPQAMRCVAGPTGSSGYQLGIQVQTAQVQHQEQSTVRSLTYVSGTETYENPDYAPVQREVRRDQREASRADTAWRLAKADCDASTTALANAGYCADCEPRRRNDRDCARANALAQSDQDAYTALNDAVSRANNTPELLTRDVYSTFNYTETSHTWRMPYTLHFQGLGAKPVSFDAQDAIGFSGVEHVGFEAGNLAPAPRRDPMVADYADALDQQIVARVGALAKDELATRVAAIQAKCGARGENWTADWLECQSAAAYLANQDPGAALLDSLARWSGAGSSNAAVPRLTCAR